MPILYCIDEYVSKRVFFDKSPLAGETAYPTKACKPLIGPW
jgi:hypothetical protein